MKRYSFIFAVISLLSLLLTGCVTTTGDKNLGQAALKNFETRTIDANCDLVFSASMQALFDLGYTIKHSEKAAGILLGEKQDARKDDKAAMTFLFGVAGGLSVQPIVYLVNILIMPIDDNTSNVRIKTTIDGEPKLDKKAIDEIWLYIDRQVLMESPPST